MKGKALKSRRVDANRPKAGPFYILPTGELFACFDDSVAHSDFWITVLKKAFRATLDLETFEELTRHPYGCLRGRVVSKESKTIVYGVVGCDEPSFLIQIQKMYTLPDNFINQIGNDDHYAILNADKDVLADAIRLIR